MPISHGFVKNKPFILQYTYAKECIMLSLAALKISV